MLRLDHQICFAVYSAAHAFNRVYKPLLDRLGLPIRNIWSCWCCGSATACR
jgi:hypothetical protein